MYFGSGASSSSEKAILTENIVFTVLFLMPLLYGIFKSRYIEDKQKTRSYLFAGLLVTIVSGVYFIFNM